MTITMCGRIMFVYTKFVGNVGFIEVETCDE